MKFADWAKEYTAKKQAMVDKETEWKAASEQYDTFLKSTLGISVGETMEPDNVARMVMSVIKMSTEGE